tara:strand:+ start:4975 stop:5454 length:480 start_codon:yes stop_codon:yes gene_type:complete
MVGIFLVLVFVFPQIFSIDRSVSGAGFGYDYKVLVNSGICPQNRHTKTAPIKFLNKLNPLSNKSSALEAGKRLYGEKAKPTPCRLCHGIRGNGNGKLASNMEPPPRNFTCIEIMHKLPDGQLFWIIKNGSKGTKMPQHKHTLNDREIWQLIHYIRTFSK